MNPYTKKVALAAALGILVSSAIALLSLFLLFLGQPLTRVVEGSGATSVVFSQTPFAIFPLVSALLILLGIYKKILKIAWVGATLLFGIALLAIFGLGSWFLPPTMLLILVLFFLQINKYGKKA